ncbi:MAG: heme-binding protein [Hyphomicrobiaceae bacterium]|nr:heme-binding protein [Hyphomicrobiaceae bacterium]
MLRKIKIIIIGSAKYAFYNSPWTFPVLRRNEVIFELT